MILGLWPHPVVDVAVAIVGATLVGLLHVAYSLVDRVSRLEAKVDELERKV